jgi:glutaredoxin 3
MVHVVVISRVVFLVTLVLLLVVHQQRAAHAFAPRLLCAGHNGRNTRASLVAARGEGGRHDRRVIKTSSSSSLLQGMKRPFLDQIATALFRLETARVDASSVMDDQGRVGEPMAWSRNDSLANRFSEFMATYGYGFKQFVADIVAGSDYNATAVNEEIDTFINDNDVAMFSFTTCPFCRRAKDALEERGIAYKAMELDELSAENYGNMIRAELGRKTKRTSVPSIFVKGRYIGGCNDGNPGLLPLLESGELEAMLSSLQQQ